MKSLLKNTAFITSVIFVLAAILRFWGLWSIDIQHDLALNSVRALGWFDFLTFEGQTSPIIWFGKIPWWAWLSFHDHPPFVFAVQYIFLSIFGQSSFSTLLSFALAGIASTTLIYILIKKTRSVQVAQLAILIFSLSSFSVWITRTGYIEGFAILPITATFVFFVLFINTNNNKYFYLTAMAIGIAILSKYTTLFLLPAVFIYLLFYKRDIFKRKVIWHSFAIFLLMMLPVIIYNIMVFKTRGHFDAALSSMVGMNPEDYSVLTREINANIFYNLKTVYQSLVDVMSFPYFVTMWLSMAYLGMQWAHKKADPLIKILLLFLIFLFTQFLFSGASPRFMGIIVPLSSVAMALALHQVWKTISANRGLSKFVVILFIAIFSYEVIYNVNTNILTRPIGSEDFAYSSFRIPDYGFTELDRYMRENVYGPLPKKRYITELTDSLTFQDLTNKVVILKDDSVHWHLDMWYYHRYKVYYNVPLVSVADIIRSSGDQDFADFLKNTGAKSFWLIAAEGPAIVRNQFDQYNKWMNYIIESLETSGVEPVHEIYNNKGDLTFSIYNFVL